MAFTYTHLFLLSKSATYSQIENFHFNVSHLLLLLHQCFANFKHLMENKKSSDNKVELFDCFVAHIPSCCMYTQ